MPEINLEINQKLMPFLTKSKPIKVVIGGRGSGKSIAVCDMAAGYWMQAQGQSILCIREFQNSINESIHNEIIKSVDERL